MNEELVIEENEEDSVIEIKTCPTLKSILEGPSPSIYTLAEFKADEANKEIVKLKKEVRILKKHNWKHTKRK